MCELSLQQSFVDLVEFLALAGLEAAGAPESSGDDVGTHHGDASRSQQRPGVPALKEE